MMQRLREGSPRCTIISMFAVASLANFNNERWHVRVAGANILQLPLIQSVSLFSPLSLVGQEPLHRACVRKGYARADLSSTLNSINLDCEHLKSKTGRYRGALVRGESTSVDEGVLGFIGLPTHIEPPPLNSSLVIGCCGFRV